MFDADIFDLILNKWTHFSTALSVSKSKFAAARLNSVAYFAGGYNGSYISNVDSFNGTNWSICPGILSIGRSGLSSAASKDLVFFFGGYNGNYSKVVDIFDPVLVLWYTSSLSISRSNTAAVSAGTRIFVAGGYNGTYSSVVDIYDTILNAWTSTSLLHPFSDGVAVSIGCKVLFGGSSEGSMNTVEVYDMSTSSWTILAGALSAGRQFYAAVTINSIVIFAGGNYVNNAPSDVVDYLSIDCYLGSGHLVNGLCQCRGGFYLSDDSLECLPCLAGTFSNILNATSIMVCSNCIAGTFSLIGSSSCTSCNEGTFSDTSVATSISVCQNCSAGTFSSAGATTCQVCLPGFYSPFQRASSCLSCPGGTFSNSNASTFCFNCQPGNYSYSQSSSCQLCKAGTYSTSFKSSVCMLCAAGNYSVSGTTYCSYCASGKYSIFQGSSIDLCLNCNATSLIANIPSSLLAKNINSISIPYVDLISPANLMTSYFASGTSVNNLGFIVTSSFVSTVVSIFNITSGSWFGHTFQIARFGIVAVSVRNVALFVGGLSISNVSLSNVDVYDSISSTWSSTSDGLSYSRFSYAATSLSNIALFAGGYGGISLSAIASVECYNHTTNAWTNLGDLTLARGELAATSVVDFAMFAGGYTGVSPSNVVNIYDFRSTSWSTSILSVARYRLSAITVGQYGLFVGGITVSNNSLSSSVVDIYDSLSLSWSSLSLSVSRYLVGTATSGCTAFFAGGFRNSTYLSSLVEVYDVYRKTLNVLVSGLSSARGALASFTLGSIIFFGAGQNSFNTSTDILDLFSINCPVGSSLSTSGSCQCFPGYYLSGSICAPCIQGTYSITFGGLSLSSCLACPAGTFSNSNATSCFYCLVGSYSAGNLSPCTTCPTNTSTIEVGGSICSQCLPTSTMSFGASGSLPARSLLSIASFSNLVFFAGGVRNSTFFNLVNILDLTNGIWSVYSPGLSQARASLVSTNVKSKVIFAGGITLSTYSSVIDIYDGIQLTWSTFILSTARTDLAASSINNLAFFAGGNNGSYLSIVDMYNFSSNIWSVSNSLSVARSSLVGVSTGTGLQVMFAGGYSAFNLETDIVDIYDANPYSNFWYTATLSQARVFLTSTNVGPLALFAGGYRNLTGESSRVDLYDSLANFWSTGSLSYARHFISAASSGCKAIFAGGFNGYSNSTVIDIYDTLRKSWSSISALSIARFKLTSITVGNLAIFAGGIDSSGSESPVIEYFNAVCSPEMVILNGRCLCPPGTFQSSDSCILCSGSTYSIYPGSDACAFYPPNNVSLGSGFKLTVIATLFAGSGVKDLGLVAGGITSTGCVGNVDILNITSGVWTKYNNSLSIPRYALTATTVGNLVLFAGGFNGYTWFDRVDIFNSLTSTWSTSSLSISRAFFASASVRNLAFFAGGVYNTTSTSGISINTIDIYNSTANFWTIHSDGLSLARGYLSATSTDLKVIFAGGQRTTSSSALSSNVVDIYDFLTNVISNATLSIARSFLAATSVGSLSLFAGGIANLASSTVAVSLTSFKVCLNSAPYTTCTDFTSTVAPYFLRWSGANVRFASTYIQFQSFTEGANQQYNLFDPYAGSSKLFFITDSNGLTQSQTNNNWLNRGAPGGFNFEYIGCFVDDFSRDLNSASSGQSYVHNCAQACIGYIYFAMQDGSTCFCGNAYQTRPQYVKVDDSQCNCYVNPFTMGCTGAGWRNAIYKVPQDLTYSYVGCYQDSSPRDLSMGYTYLNSVYNCAVFCNGYLYFGTQNNGACFCGNTYGLYGILPDSACGCSGSNCITCMSTGGKNCIFKSNTVFGNSAISSVVDIYNTISNKWSNATLSTPRMHLSAATLGNKALFAGGTSNSVDFTVVDIFDARSNSWTAISSGISVGRSGGAFFTVGTVAIYAGGSRLLSYTSNSISLSSSPSRQVDYLSFSCVGGIIYFYFFIYLGYISNGNCLCFAGSYFNGTNCLNCPINTYSLFANNKDSTMCKSCPPGINFIINIF